MDREPSDVIRAAILKGEFSPNQHLVEADVTEKYAISRGNVREAFVRLELEGLLVKRQNKGMYVRNVSLDEAIELLETRRVLESFCAYRASQRSTPADVKVLRQLNREMGRLKGDQDLQEFRTLNSEFHSATNALSAHATTIALINTLNARIYAQYRDRALLTASRIQQSVAEHNRIIDSIAAENAEGAEAAMRDHLIATIDVLKSGAVTLPGYPLTRRTVGQV